MIQLLSNKIMLRYREPFGWTYTKFVATKRIIASVRTWPTCHSRYQLSTIQNQPGPSADSDIRWGAPLSVWNITRVWSNISLVRINCVTLPTPFRSTRPQITRLQCSAENAWMWPAHIVQLRQHGICYLATVVCNVIEAFDRCFRSIGRPAAAFVIFNTIQPHPVHWYASKGRTDPTYSCTL